MRALLRPGSPSAERVSVQVEFDLGLPPNFAKPPRAKGSRVSEAMSSVGQFHASFDLPMATRPNPKVPVDLGELRIDLLEEEVGEFREAVEQNDLVAIADALADILYVTYGAAITFGIDLDAVVREVHRSNMSKLGPDGRPILRADGKVLKPATYSPPEISRVLLDQPPLFLD
jgi:predicted HAD superfamily Cof-like phosphohydrolase